MTVGGLSLNDHNSIARERVEESGLHAVESQAPLHLVTTHGQLKIHTASYRGSFSAVLSDSLRAAGLGSRVLIAQLLKGGVNQGPQNAIELCGRLEWIRPAINSCLTEKANKINSEELAEEEFAAINEIWEACKKRLFENTVDLMVIDEVGIAIEMGLIEENEVIAAIQTRPTTTDLILTGPYIPSQIMEMADQVTKLRCS